MTPGASIASRPGAHLVSVNYLTMEIVIYMYM